MRSVRLLFGLDVFRATRRQRRAAYRNDRTAAAVVGPLGYGRSLFRRAGETNVSSHRHRVRVRYTSDDDDGQPIAERTPSRTRPILYARRRPRRTTMAQHAPACRSTLPKLPGIHRSFAVSRSVPSGSVSFRPNKYKRPDERRDDGDTTVSGAKTAVHVRGNATQTATVGLFLFFGNARRQYYV